MDRVILSLILLTSVLLSSVIGTGSHIIGSACRSINRPTYRRWPLFFTKSQPCVTSLVPCHGRYSPSSPPSRFTLSSQSRCLPPHASLHDQSPSQTRPGSAYNPLTQPSWRSTFPFLPQKLKPTLSLGSFNIQHFSLKKSSNPYLMARICFILLQYDIISISEIRDVSSRIVIRNLMDTLNTYAKLVREEEGDEYGVVYSERLGKVHKEQVAVVYRRKLVKPISWFLYDGVRSHEDILKSYERKNGNERDKNEQDDGDESSGDSDDDDHDSTITMASGKAENSDGFEFARAPFVTIFQSLVNPNFQFLFLSVHVMPSRAVQELDQLGFVYTDVVKRWNDAVSSYSSPRRRFLSSLLSKFQSSNDWKDAFFQSLIRNASLETTRSKLVPLSSALIASDLNSDGDSVPLKSWPFISLYTSAEFMWFPPHARALKHVTPLGTSVRRPEMMYDRVVVGREYAGCIVRGSGGVHRWDLQVDLKGGGCLCEEEKKEGKKKKGENGKNGKKESVKKVKKEVREDIGEVLKVSDHYPVRIQIRVDGKNK